MEKIMIKISVWEDSEEHTHVVGGETEESVSVVPFSVLVEEYTQKKKTLILACVTTCADRAPNIHSFYYAHNINKVIFRTEKKGRVLHRIRARNPLNNMPIVGDVVYYTVDTVPHAVDSAMVYTTTKYATDRDFLTNSTVRSFFAKNTLSPDEHKLLELEKSDDLPRPEQPASLLGAFRRAVARNGIYLSLILVYLMLAVCLLIFSRDSEIVFLVYCLVVVILIMSLSFFSARRHRRLTN
ncbi:MAG: uncharacterized protein A8A55_2378 [Amphiamblys sp. WSBS2006]|nr:MAG: uncharacterized protein A8A55_2378 [Amphiamblys sp. WSBS2006]